MSSGLRYVADMEKTVDRLQVERATLGDVQHVYAWRNDPVTRAMSQSMEVVEYDKHCRWFEAALQDARKYMYIGSVAGEKVGMCRFDVDAEKGIAIVSLNLNPLFRGKHLSSPFLILALQEFRRSESLDVRATIKIMNKASIACFEACGFVLESTDNTYGYYILSKGKKHD